ncbi:beta-ketoacyl synthase N-terminal-like domain-containing protein [Streptomyces sp. NPDC056441]|uniref:beta-ketoacyl synthase N-terminal-like domain-containing protein n=1 Tax=Streptomyces sp. NPDC056441 TaxID=3345817 RepID=UPI0036BCF124
MTSRRILPLSTQSVDPETGSRPFDVKRSGFVMGEGAGMMVLERAEFARARGARAYGTPAGSAVSSSANHITTSDAEGPAFASSQACSPTRRSGEPPGSASRTNARAACGGSGRRGRFPQVLSSCAVEQGGMPCRSWTGRIS